MKISKRAQAGTMQSSDLMVFAEPADELVIEIDSTVAKQYEHLIRAKITEVVERMNVTSGILRIKDRGALDYAIIARVEAVINRAKEQSS
ncbi:citrate lyase acyl carrier protein [Geovibrio thiophilus]|uniref:Citrate lyase acyl carrier protein n=1 Tax=Geovibrio thiophilus TaxID=139438 RepID=A0A3R5UY30_9BACT|nr:citrate lyase acyl carrier protein [Geovibrio thiophilus]QAR32607.1 citrate lyase acyl carrier protein [Geovibrio thiophilus]